MLYLIFLLLAVGYNWRKFSREKHAFISSLIEAKNISHREMILGHHFYVFIFETFLSLIVAHFITEGAFVVGILGLGMLYIFLLVAGFFFYQYFLKYIERQTELVLRESFNQHIIKELRVSFAVIFMPILIYSIINWAFLDEVYKDWGSLWFIGLIFNIIFVSVLTILCTVIIMLRLIPNREITEPEYLQIINHRLAQINMPQMRVRWIESDIKNAFVVGLKLLKFSNQTMFLGKSLRKALTLEEFDAVVAHELAHVANRHSQKRIIDLLKNLLSVLVGIGIVMICSIGLTLLFWGEDFELHSTSTAYFFVIGLVSWVTFNYALLFDTIRSHEYEADAYAVLNLKVNPKALISALNKLSAPAEIPEYLKTRTNQVEEKNRLMIWVRKIFSTHPSVIEREESLHFKITSNLPFNYYFSTAHKIRTWLGALLNWKVSVPLATALIVFCTFNILRYKKGQELISFIKNSSAEKIMENEKIVQNINSNPNLIGRTLMYYVVKRKDDSLINHFFERGADKGRSLAYVTELEDYELFEKYYKIHQSSLSDDDYFMILRKTAKLNFTQGYRLLVNTKRFEDMDSSHKADIARLNQNSRKDRSPASIKP